MLVRIAKLMLSTIKCLFGYLFFLTKKKNIKNINSSFVNFYCLTKGLSNSIFNYVIMLNYKFKKKNNLNFVEIINSSNLEETIREINNTAYSIIPKYLNIIKINRVLNIIGKVKCNYIIGDQIFKSNSIDDVPEQAKVIDLDENELLKEDIIKEIIHDPLFYQIAKKYFKSVPILTNVGLRISRISEKPKSKEAQFYHFDMDRPKWLKFFIYLNDVDTKEHGPHCFIKYSHKTFSKPYKLLLRGYERIQDEELFKYFKKSDEKVILGKSGTVAIGDTSAFHKGLNPRTKIRKVLTIEFSNSLFGSSINKYNVSKKNFKNTYYNFEEEFYSKFV